MFSTWLILLPELSLLAYQPIAWWVNRYRLNKTAKTFFSLSKFFLIWAILFTIIFYNKSAFPELWINSKYSTLFKLAIYFASLIWFYLSSKWFLNKNRSSFMFYQISMFIVLLFGLLLSASSFLVPLLAIPLLCWLIGLLILQHWDEDKVRQLSQIYFIFSAIFCLILWVSVAIIKSYCGDISFNSIQIYLQKTTSLPIVVYASIVGVISVLLFMMAAAPFHFWFVGAISSTVLPVCGFLTIIPPLVYLSSLITLMTGSFSPIANNLKPLLQCFAGFSLVLGALSANGQTNIRKLFAFSTIYNLGFMLFGIIGFKSDAIVSAFIYTVIYIIAMIGIYTVFLALKSKGEYLSDISKIKGLSVNKPYVSAAFLLFMVSLIGVPPLLGFWGRLSLINTLIINDNWEQAVFMLFALLFIANAFLQIIRRIYFDSPQNTFDRTDKAIYISLFINLLLILISILNPSYLLNDAEAIFRGGL